MPPLGKLTTRPSWWSSKRTVLVIDSDRHLRDLVYNMFIPTGHRVAVGRTRQRLAAILATTKIDLLIVDPFLLMTKSPHHLFDDDRPLPPIVLAMRDLDGWAHREVARWQESIPPIAVSVMVKPGSRTLLAQAIKDVIAYSGWAI